MSKTERLARTSLIAHDLNFGERFVCRGKIWQHCGWYSVVEHVAAFCLSNCPESERKKIIAHVEPVARFVETFYGGLGI